jgi:hypothetical protein
MIVNFSEVTDQVQDSSTGTKVGIFILRAGLGTVTVPVIGKGETLFPIDSVFIESEAKFRPLSPSTISYIMSAASTAVGKATKMPAGAVTNPSLTDLIVPPRTGKFAYASTSRLTEFLANMPDSVKKFTFEKISAEQSVYNTLDNMFGLRGLFEALNGHSGGTGLVNNVATGPAHIRRVGFSVITSPREVRDLMNDSLTKSFLDQGYVVTGGSDSLRTAVGKHNFNDIGTYTVINPSLEGGREYMVSMKNGTSKLAYLPKYHRITQTSGADRLASIFSDGTYARGTLVTHGDPTEGLAVLKHLFETSPPCLLKDLGRGQDFMIITTGGEALGPFHSNSVTRTALGTEVKCSYGLIKRIHGYNNFTKEVELIGDVLFVPHNIVVLTLASDVTEELEVSVNFANRKKENIALQYLGAELDLRHDGVEFSANGAPVGSFPQAMKLLVEKENIEPSSAENFLKQAQETKFVKIFLSKQASTSDFQPAQFPQNGAPASPTPDTGLNGSFMPAIQSAKDLGDSQVMESTIIAQLLQVPELFEYIQEYLPEIDQTVDKLGRILFLTRAKLEQVSEALDSDTVFSMVAQIKAVYRQLGDTSLKLKTLTEASVGFDKEKAVGQTNGQ